MLESEMLNNSSQMYQSPDKNSKNLNFQEYQSPYSVRQLKKQEMELVMSQPKPAKDKQAMKQFLKLISQNDEGPSSPTSLNKSAYSSNSARKQRMQGPLSVSQIISPRVKSPKASEKQSEYQQLLETERPKRSELSTSNKNAIDEEKDKQKLDHLKHKLQSEKGFTQDDIQTIDQNMIFFKCVADIKKRQQEQRSKMNPNRIKNVQSKISQVSQNRLSSNYGSRQKKNRNNQSNQRAGPQIVLDGDFEVKDQSHQAGVNSNQFSDNNSDEELMREEMKDLGIEDIIQQQQDIEVDQEEADDLLRDTLSVAEFENSTEQLELNKLKDIIESQDNNQNNLQLQDSGQNNPQKRRTPSVGNLLMSASLQNVEGNLDEQFNVQYIDDGQEALGSSGIKKNSSQRRLSQNNSNSNNSSKILPQQRDRQNRNRLSIGQNIVNEQSLSYNKTIISNISPVGRGSISPERPHYLEATESFLKMMSPKNEKSQSGSNNQSFSKPQKTQVRQGGYLQSKAEWISKLQPIKKQQQK